MRLPDRFRHGWALVLAPLLLVDSAVLVRAGETPCAVVGYLPHYRLKELTPIQLRGITDVIYFGLEPSADGRLADPPIPPGALAKLEQIRKENACRILVAVGGWGRSENFPKFSRDPVARQRFVSEAAEFCKANGFSGIDYDWEHPKDAGELELYRELIADTRERFKAEGLQVTVAQASWQDLGKGVYALVERVHLMAYDHEFPQATLAKSIADVERLLGWGCPPDKLALGVPFYGRNAKREGLPYRQFGAGLDPLLDEKDGFAFNGRATMIAKTNYVLEHHLAGIMIWEVAQDSTDEATSLLKAITGRLGEAAPAADGAEQRPEN